MPTPFSITELIAAVKGNFCLELPKSYEDFKALGIKSLTLRSETETFTECRSPWVSHRTIPAKRGGCSLKIELVASPESRELHSKLLQKPVLHNGIYYSPLNKYISSTTDGVYYKSTSICTEQDLIQELIKLKTSPAAEVTPAPFSPNKLLNDKNTIPRYFFYAGFATQTHGKTYFQGFYQNDNLNPADGFGEIITEIAKHYAYDPAKVHFSAFTPVNL